MRLTEKQLGVIRELFVVYFLPEDKLWVFGSRVDDLKKGGDIDFYIETHHAETSQIAEKKISFLRDLKKGIGDQKIDVIINVLEKNKQLRIYDEAKSTGIRLL